MGSWLSIITLNVNGLNAPIKRQRLAEWIQKQDPYFCCLQETYFRPGDTYRLKMKGWKKIVHAYENQKNAAATKHISDKINFKQCYKRLWRTLHNDQRINPRRRYSNYKYICTQHRSTTICKTNANKYEKARLTITQ